ncbi:MAG TPA: hemerythrin domain-containing protein [Candidatus Eisenbacteria bacterium]|nr:hemerythrin domain-containing protein [Candidatus Eisenbacteria bacterium]
MKPTEVLVEEHRVIERVLTALETAAGRLAAGDTVPPEFFLRAADFIRGFADGCHHHKEEDVLFPALTAAGIPNEGGPVGVMLFEHEEGRRFTAAMRAGAERLKAGDAGARDEVVRNARGYVELLRDHIAKENNVLFPMADQVIRGGAAAKMTESFEEIEREEQGDHDRYLALAADLEQEASR